MAPNIGRAVLFSTVFDVMGREADYHFYQAPLIDKPYRSSSATIKNKDGTVLFEDPGTITAHDAVRPGTKYNITAYLRLYSRTIDVLKNIYIHIHYYLSIFMYILFTLIYPSFENYFVVSMDYKLNRNTVTTNGASVNVNGLIC